MAPELIPMATALKSMKRANSGLTWIRQRHVMPFLKTWRSPRSSPMNWLPSPRTTSPRHTPNSSWVFRGYSPGQHIQARLKAVFSTRAARLGTLHELTKLGPVPIIADALGYHPSTIERHAIGSASTYAQYIAAARDQRTTS